MRDIAPIVERLSRCRAGLEASLNAFTPETWRKAPGSGRWSAAEVIAHVSMVEDKITSTAEKLIRGEPRPLFLLKRVHIPVALVKWRGVKRKSPIPLDPALLKGKEEMLASLTALRRRSIALLEKNRERDLSAYCWRHPFFGYLNYYTWFKVMALHEIRHTKQIREIVDSFHR